MSVGAVVAHLRATVSVLFNGLIPPRPRTAPAESLIRRGFTALMCMRRSFAGRWRRNRQCTIAPDRPHTGRVPRNNADWHRLLEICALTRTLILDDHADAEIAAILNAEGVLQGEEIRVMGILGTSNRTVSRCMRPAAELLFQNTT